jgi:predicted nucleic acid-binding protein|tara:strand:+ start:7330 stop:7683 length:354 start_codon:yes stop_codon:yes gene_type:complete
MGSVCLDTDVLIEHLKGRGEVYKKLEIFDDFYISILTVYEFMRGSDQEKTRYLNHLSLNYKTVILASKIYKSLYKEGTIIPDNDILIGATCIINNVPLLTLNKKHFVRLKKFGLKLV